MTSLTIRIAQFGRSQRRLTPRQAELAVRWSPPCNHGIDMSERAKLYAEYGLANAHVDAMVAWWQVAGMAMTEGEWLNTIEAMGGDDVREHGDAE